MSFNRNNTINPSNYEEWFVLYVDNELRAEEKAMVEAFLLLHPNLQDELDVLLSTKLPAEDVLFLNKESLTAAAMKLNAVDEDLLLYIDNELSSDDEKRVGEEIAADEALQLQYNILLQTKLDDAEVISHPNKKELYRHTEKVVFLSAWMRVAAVIVLVLFATIFFFTNRNSNGVIPQPDMAQGTKAGEKQIDSAINNIPTVDNMVHQQSTVNVTPTKQEQNKGVIEEKLKGDLPQKQAPQQETAANEPNRKVIPSPVIESIKVEVSSLTQTTPDLNKVIANRPATSIKIDSLNLQEAPAVAAVTDEDFKSRKTSAKGLLRKVSRFIGRRTGIGTVNVDNEMMVGMVALKLN